MAPQSFEVGPLEMQVLGILERAGDQPVASIQAELKRRGQDLAYTTVMTVVSRLFDKGFVKRRKEGRGFLYSTAGGKEGPSRRLFHKVRQALFHSDRLKPILALLDDSGELTEAELRELRRAVDERLKKK